MQAFMGGSMSNTGWNTANYVPALGPLSVLGTGTMGMMAGNMGMQGGPGGMFGWGGMTGSTDQMGILVGGPPGSLTAPLTGIPVWNHQEMNQMIFGGMNFGGFGGGYGFPYF
jgi:hypothetical protein